MQIPLEQRKEMLDEMVLLVPIEKRQQALKVTNELADLYEGQDLNTIGVLWRAVQKGKFDEYAQKLREYYNSEGKNVAVEVRSLPAGMDPGILEMLLKKEEQIRSGDRDPKDRLYLPKIGQNIMVHPESIRMELFFLKCYLDMGVKPGED